MDWVNSPSVGGLKWIDVDWNVIIRRRGVRHMTYSTRSFARSAWRLLQRLAISVFVLSLLVFLIIVLIVEEPSPPFYTGRLQWRLDFSKGLFTWAILAIRGAAMATDHDVAACSSNGTDVDTALPAMMCVGAVSLVSSGTGG